MVLSLVLSSLLSAPDTQNILIVGNGGREHAITNKIAQSKNAKRIFVAPGNGGTATMENVTNIPIKATDVDALLTFAQTNNIHLTFVGPEAPLADGIVDKFHNAKLACIGPTRAAARIESSKAFSKRFMMRHEIPTAAYAEISTVAQGQDYVDQHALPLVIKADGLAAGKGVVIAQTPEEAMDTIKTMLDGSAFGQAGKKVIVEEFLDGQEVSFIVLSDGQDFVPLATAQDYKRRNNRGLGPNTGGMGAYSPAPCVTPELHEKIIETIIKPTIEGMQEEGTPFSGFLYAGLMITPDGEPKVLEYNCRLGDPETQVILSRMKSDLLPLGHAVIKKQLATKSIEWDPRTAVTVVLADGDYPYKSNLGQSISIKEKILGTDIFHAGTKLIDNQLVTNGGRILAVTALADSFGDARELAYKQIENIELTHGHYRTDIGLQVSQRAAA